MIKILTIIGARPQIIKAAALSRAIKNDFSKSIKEIILHTGQHYDENMSKVFFNELQIPLPDYNLKVGSASHGVQTAQMIEGIERVILDTRPACVVMYGDTNSTLAGAVAASKLHVPVVHVEAGLRSFNKSMPEEINRIVCDHCSTLLFSPTRAGYDNLVREGFDTSNKPPFSSDKPGIFHCGDVMYDNTLFFANIARTQTNILNRLRLGENNFVLATMHRPGNTDVPQRLEAILKALATIAEKNQMTIVFPVHPRTAKMLHQLPNSVLRRKITQDERFKMIQPVSFLEMTALEENARIIITDSGGVQKEAYFFRKPGIVLRAETEWVEIVENGCAVLADAEQEKIVQAFHGFYNKPPVNYPPLFGDGNSAVFICEEILKSFSTGL
jgi:UDP-GlcNAc3NAcA epimerase